LLALFSIATPILTLSGVCAMAAPRLTSNERARIYWLFFLLNRSFDLIVQRLDELGRSGLFTSRDLREMRGLTQEVQLEINTGLLDSFEPVENDDWASSERSASLWKRDSETLTMFSFMRKNEGSNSPNRAESPAVNVNKPSQ
jgi:hypothetical protein